MIACIILNYNDSYNTIKLLKRIRNYCALDLIIIVDNCSTDSSWELFQKEKSDRVHICKTKKNGGYGYGNNYGIKYAQKYGCNYALIANPDVYFDNYFVQRLKMGFEQNEKYSVMSGIQRDILNNEEQRTAWKIPGIWDYIFSTGIVFRRLGNNMYYSLEELHSKEIFPVECVAGALLMVSVTKYMECGGYDEEMFLYCEESTLGYKMKKLGYSAAICSEISYRHLHGTSIEKSISNVVKRKKILEQSHHIFLNKYLKANKFQLALHLVVSKLALLEEILIEFFNRKKEKKC